MQSACDPSPFKFTEDCSDESGNDIPDTDDFSFEDSESQFLDDSQCVSLARPPHQKHFEQFS